MYALGDVGIAGRIRMGMGLSVAAALAGAVLVEAGAAIGDDDRKTAPNAKKAVVKTAGRIAYVKGGRSTVGGELDATAKCAAKGPRWHLIGGGGGVRNSNAYGRRHLPSSEPIYDPPEVKDAWLASTQGYAHKSTVYAICRKGKGAHLGFGGGTIEPGESETDKVACIAGERIIGGGFSAQRGQDSQVSVAAPADGPDADAKVNDAWRIRAYDVVDPFSDTVELDVVSLCLRKTNNLKVTRRSQTANIASHGNRTFRIRCRKKEHVINGGFRISGAAGDGRVGVSSPVDGGDGDKAPDDAWRVGVHNFSQSPLGVRGYAFCAR